MIERTASCACGGLRVVTRGEPLGVSICHCNNCKQRTGSAFAVTARFAREACTPSGKAAIFKKAGESGAEATFRFCPTCGGTVYWEHPAMPDAFAIAVGAFRDQKLPTPIRTVYYDMKLDWVILPPGIELLGP